MKQGEEGNAESTQAIAMGQGRSDSSNVLFYRPPLEDLIGDHERTVEVANRHTVHVKESPYFRFVADQTQAKHHGSPPSGSSDAPASLRQLDPSRCSKEDSCNISAYSDTSKGLPQNMASSLMHYQALVTDGYINKVDRMKRQQQSHVEQPPDQQTHS